VAEDRGVSAASTNRAGSATAIAHAWSTITTCVGSASTARAGSAATACADAVASTTRAGSVAYTTYADSVVSTTCAGSTATTSAGSIDTIITRDWTPIAPPPPSSRDATPAVLPRDELLHEIRAGFHLRSVEARVLTSLKPIEDDNSLSQTLARALHARHLKMTDDDDEDEYDTEDVFHE
jgi:hypothetical protein